MPVAQEIVAIDSNGAVRFWPVAASARTELKNITEVSLLPVQDIVVDEYDDEGSFRLETQITRCICAYALKKS